MLTPWRRAKQSRIATFGRLADAKICPLPPDAADSRPVTAAGLAPQNYRLAHNSPLRLSANDRRIAHEVGLASKFGLMHGLFERPPMIQQ